jgi:hypothetical protein
MVVDGEELRMLLKQTSGMIEIRTECGQCVRPVTSKEALALNLDLFVGIGNRRRIRFLRLLTRRSKLNAGSHYTQRLKGREGVNISHPIIREHLGVRVP